jgi:enoyl-CoA hydratase
MGQFLKVEHDGDGIVRVLIDRPKANALSKALLVELGELADDLRLDPPKAVIITGGPKIFAAGADINEFSDARVAFEASGLFRRTLNAWAAIPRVVIAAIEGFALGGGLELALACDFRVASRSALLGQPEIALGLIPGGGGTQRLPRLIGVAKAKELILTGRPVSGEQAREIGLVDRICEPGEADATALAWAKELAEGPLAAQGLAKAAIDEGMNMTLAEGLAYEQALFAQVFNTDDAGIGIRSFLEHGPNKAKFTGR